MANEIQNKLGSRTALTITLNSLASSSSRVGRQSTLIDNSSTQFTKIEISVKVTSVGTPTANTALYVHLIRGNGTERSDSAGASDAALTQLNADLIGILKVGGSPSSGQVLEGSWIIHDPGREWGIQVWHDMTAALHGSAGNAASYVAIVPEVQ